MTDSEFREFAARELTAMRLAIEEQTKSLRSVNLQLDILGKVVRDLRNALQDDYDLPSGLFDDGDEHHEGNGWSSSK